MKQYVSIPILGYEGEKEGVTPSLIDELVAIYPEGERTGRAVNGPWRRSFCFIDIPRDDPRVELVLSVLARHGWDASGLGTYQCRPKEFCLILKRKYTKRDLARCEYLSFNGRKYHDDLGWRTEPDGLPILSARLLRKFQGHDTVSGPRPGWNIVSDRVKRAVESADLRHIAIRPVALVRGRGRPDDPRLSWEDHGDPWWELTSDLALPPLSPSVQIVAQDNSPFVSYETQNLELREGHYQIPELHYLRSEIEEREPFDLALTHEHFGKPPFQQRKIASQRLYQLFQEHGFKASWIPVRLDD